MKPYEIQHKKLYSKEKRTYKTNSTVAAAHRIKVVMEADDCDLVKDCENTKEAPLPEDICAPVDNTLSYSAEAFAHENIQYGLSTQVEDEA